MESKSTCKVKKAIVLLIGNGLLLMHKLNSPNLTALAYPFRQITFKNYTFGEESLFYLKKFLGLVL